MSFERSFNKPVEEGKEYEIDIKEISRRAPSVIITGHRQEMADLVRKALNSSAYACLYKPIDVEELLRVVDEILARRPKAG